MTFGEIKRKSLKGVKTIIYGRTLFVVLAFLIQFALMIATYLFSTGLQYVRICGLCRFRDFGGTSSV